MNQTLQQETHYILTAASGLGTYIPALRMRHRLESAGIKAEMTVLEHYYSSEQQAKINKTKKAFQDNFKRALMAQKLTRVNDLSENLDPKRIEALIEQWKTDGVRHFILFSGFWLPVIERYRKCCEFELSVELVHLDAIRALSWENNDHLIREEYREVWLFHKDERERFFRITEASTFAQSEKRREERLVIHGGGWGIGTFSDILDELKQTSYTLDVSVNHIDMAKPHPNCNYYMVQQDWEPWQPDERGEFTFPPVQRLGIEAELNGTCSKDRHVICELIEKSMAIVSKPGGATILESLEQATPLIYLKPYGNYEKENGEFWESLGFAISYENWKEMGFSIDPLLEMQERLRQLSEKITDYGRVYHAATNRSQI